MGADQFKELKLPQKENERLRKTVSDLTLDKLILVEAVRETIRRTVSRPGHLAFLNPVRRHACIDYVRR